MNDTVHQLDQPWPETGGRWSVACSCGWKTVGTEAHVSAASARHLGEAPGAQ